MIIASLLEGVRAHLTSLVAVESLDLLHVLKVELGLELTCAALSCLGRVWRD